MTVDVTNLRASAVVAVARLHAHVNVAREFFHEGWKVGDNTAATAQGIYVELRTDLRKLDPDDAYLHMLRLWRLVHSPADWPCLRCMTRATEPPGLGHVTVADINPVTADDLCALCLNQPVEGDPDEAEVAEPRLPERHIRLGEAS